MRQLTPVEVNDLVAYIDHVNESEPCGACCQQSASLLDKAVSAITRAREQRTVEQSMAVESVLGGDDNRKARPCSTCSLTKTILRCKLCKLPCCGPCNKGNHQHTVRVRSDVKLTYQVGIQWGYWKDGKKVLAVEQRKVGERENQWRKGAIEPIFQTFIAGTDERIDKTYKKYKDMPIRHAGRALYAGDVFQISASEFDATYYEFVD